MKQLRNGRRLLSVPYWAISLGKFMGPVFVAVAIGYARFTTVENRVETNEIHLKNLDAKLAAGELLNGGMDRRLNTLEVKQQVLEKDLSASLARIESTIKDVQVDVKDLQKSHKQ